MMKISNIFNKVAVALGATATIAMASCSDTDCPNYWDDHYGPYEPVEKPRYMWVDAAANSFYVLNNKDGIKDYVTKARKAGFTDLLIDVRGTTGDVLFKTDRVAQAEGFWQWKRNAAAGTSSYEYCPNEQSFDYLQAWIDEGHEQGIRIHAAMNTMVGGQKPSNGNPGQGMVFRDASKKDWVTTLNMPDNIDYGDPNDPNDDWIDDDGGLMNMLDVSWISGEMFLNPHHPDVQAFIVGLVGDLAMNYPQLDGIILDRGRFLDHRSDFSELTKKQFEEYIGKEIANWPGDVMPFKATSVPTENFPVHYKKWWEFRAKTIHDLVEKAAAEAHSRNTPIQFGCYVGAWYGSYYQNGVNWASPNFDPVQTKSYQVWATNDYKDTGYADHIDILILGCYTAPDKIYGSADWTAEGFAANGMMRTMGSCPLVIGGPDFGNWPTENQNYVKPNVTESAAFYHEAATNVVDACINACDGFFLFDIIHLENSPEYWKDVKAGINKYLDDKGIEHEDESDENTAA